MKTSILLVAALFSLQSFTWGEPARYTCEGVGITINIRNMEEFFEIYFEINDIVAEKQEAVSRITFEGFALAWHGPSTSEGISQEYRISIPDIFLGATPSVGFTTQMGLYQNHRMATHYNLTCMAYSDGLGGN